MDSTLFLVGSPFQCLCMLEAVDYFGISNYDVLIPEIGTGQTTEQVKSLLRDKGIEYETYNINHAIKDFIPFFLRRHKHYKNIFVGDYYNPTSEAMAAFFGTWGYNLYFMDDGTQALMLFSERPRYRYSAKKWEYWFKLYYGIGRIKGRKKPYFFTIYDVYSKRFTIIRNEFRTLKEITTGKHQEGCFIIGTNSSILKFRDCTYIEMLEQLVSGLRIRFPNEKIVYCPHRRDLNNGEIKAWCISRGVTWFDTRVNVEYDFTTLGYDPLFVVGFTSNALYTLRMIFPRSTIRTVYYHRNTAREDEETEVIRRGMNEKGIETLILDDLLEQ